MPSSPRNLADLLQRDRTHPVICVAAGSGQVAASAVKGGADMLMAISAGVYRQLGVGSLASYLPFGNSNTLTRTLALKEVLPRSQHVPVVAGLMWDERVEEQLEEYRASGVQGVVNWPTISFVDGAFRAALEADGWTMAEEIRLLTKARARGLIPVGFALSENDALALAEAGLDILILNMGLTHEADLPTKKDQLQQEIKKLHGLVRAVKGGGHRPLLLAFGGAATQPEDYAQILRQVPIDGFAGGSVFERLPVHETVAATVRDFRGAGLAVRRQESESGLGEMIGRCPEMKVLFRRMQQVAPFDVNVCIEGESGTGKELVATQLHRMSRRSSHPFVTINCGAIPEGLLESELFGHEKGSFTGAHRRRIGKFELAQGGTLFLDEIGDLTLHGQVALLRAIQQKEIIRVGGDHPVAIDVRILTATHQNLEEMVARGKFRADLFYRLNQMAVQVPPLRQRREDIPLLVHHFLERWQIQLDRKIKGISPEFLDRLLEYEWPGNVRELQHIIGQAVMLETGSTLKGKEVVFKTTPTSVALEEMIQSGDTRNEVFRRKMVEQAMALARGNKSKAAEMLGITRPTLYAWMKEL